MQAQQLPNQSSDVPLIHLTNPEIMKSDYDSKAANTDAMVSVVSCVHYTSSYIPSHKLLVSKHTVGSKHDV